MEHIFKRVTCAVQAFTSWVKPVAVIAVCTLVIFSSADPALAFGNSSSKPSDGIAKLESVQEKSEQALASELSSGTDSARQVMRNAEAGLNGVQGAADKGKMISPDEATGNTVKKELERTVEEVKR